jgi:hypothetical protein
MKEKKGEMWERAERQKSRKNAKYEGKKRK